MLALHNPEFLKKIGSEQYPINVDHLENVLYFDLEKENDNFANDLPKENKEVVIEEEDEKNVDHENPHWKGGPLPSPIKEFYLHYTLTQQEEEIYKSDIENNNGDKPKEEEKVENDEQKEKENFNVPPVDTQDYERIMQEPTLEISCDEQISYDSFASESIIEEGEENLFIPPPSTPVRDPQVEEEAPKQPPNIKRSYRDAKKKKRRVVRPRFY